MSENKFDEFFRKKLQKYSSPVPGDMWQRIQQKKDKNRRGFFFKWFLAGVLLILLTAGYFITYTNKDTGNQKVINPGNKQNIEVQKASNRKVKDAAKDAPIKTSQDTVRANSGNNTISSNRHFDNSETHIYSVKHQNKKSIRRQGFSSKSASTGGHILKQKEQGAKYIKTMRSLKDSINIRITNEQDSSINIYQTDENTIKKNADTTTISEAIKIAPPPGDSSLNNERAPLKDTSAKENQSRQKKWFLEVFVSPDIPFSTITPGNGNVVDFLNRSFKPQISNTAGARVSRSFSKHFSVKTGFQYSQINAKFNDSIPIVNRYKSIDVPFLIGYSAGNPGFRTTINAGVIFNLNSWYKGRIIDSNGVADINAANIYKHNTGISLYLGLSFSKQLNNKIQLFTEPYFRYRLSYMTKLQTAFNQKIHVAGALFGLKYNFQMSRQHK